MKTSFTSLSDLNQQKITGMLKEANDHISLLAELIGQDLKDNTEILKTKAKDYKDNKDEEKIKATHLYSAEMEVTNTKKAIFTTTKVLVEECSNFLVSSEQMVPNRERCRKSEIPKRRNRNCKEEAKADPSTFEVKLNNVNVESSNINLTANQSAKLNFTNKEEKGTDGSQSYKNYTVSDTLHQM